MHTFNWVILRICVLSAISFVAIAVPSFHLISSFTGCIGGVMLSFVLPAMFHARLFAPTRFSWSWWQNAGLVLFGILGGLTGVYFNIKSLVSK
jgi:hypothetical protein